MNRRVQIELFLLFVVAVIWFGPAMVSSQPAPVTVQPAYGGAPYQLLGQQGGITKTQGDRIIELLESQDKRLANLESAGKPAIPKADRLTVAKARCASCHTPTKQAGGFILFVDDARTALKPLTKRELVLIKEHVQPVSGDMPKPSPGESFVPMTPEERSVFE